MMNSAILILASYINGSLIVISYNHYSFEAFL